MNQYNRLLHSSLETDSIGFSIGQTYSSNVFTPLGSFVIGWGSNGVHFCHIPEVGDTVFCVDPCAPHGDQIHPVANNITHFLELILSCSGTTAICNAYRWSRSRFDSYIHTIPLSNKQKSVLRALSNICHLGMIDDPYSQIASLQKSFDYSTLSLHPDFDDHSSLRPGGFQWEVFYGEGFCRTRKGEKSANALPLSSSFERSGAKWIIPGVYDSAKGFVVDCCVQIEKSDVKAFCEKWLPREHENLSQEDHLLLDVENPLELNAKVSLQLDGRKILPERCHKRVYIPWENVSSDVWRTVRHYDLDEDAVWVLHRYHFPKKGRKKKTPLRSMTLCIEAEDQIIPGIKFTDPAVGDRIEFSHPQTGIKHTLCVTEYSREQLDSNFLIDPPNHYIQLCCTLSPDLDGHAFVIRDCAENDPFRPEQSRETDEVASGIIGKSDGPTSIFLSSPKKKGYHTYLSSFHYEPAKTVTWRTELCCQLHDSMTIRLLGGNEQK